MRAITVTDDHRMTLVEVDEPTAAAGEVLIDVVAAGVNRADLAQVAGHYPPPAGAPEVPGLEVSPVLSRSERVPSPEGSWAFASQQPQV